MFIPPATTRARHAVSKTQDEIDYLTGLRADAGLLL